VSGSEVTFRGLLLDLVVTKNVVQGGVSGEMNALLEFSELHAFGELGSKLRTVF
jgi:hypothetical protein